MIIPLSMFPWCAIQGWNCKEILDASQSQESKMNTFPKTFYLLTSLKGNLYFWDSFLFPSVFSKYVTWGIWVKDPCEPKLSSLSSLFVVESWCVYVQNRLRRSHRCHDGRRTSTLHQPLLYGKLQVCLNFRLNHFRSLTILWCLDPQQCESFFCSAPNLFAHLWECALQTKQPVRF